MTKSDIKKMEKTLSENKEENQKNEKVEKENVSPKEETVEDKLKVVQEKLLRTMAEMENQRRRFEKEKKEAFEFGGYNFAGESLSLLDNIDRAIISFKNDENLKTPKRNSLEQWLKWRTKEGDLKKKNKRHLNSVVLILLRNLCCS